jgi:hypothetical protein
MWSGYADSAGLKMMGSSQFWRSISFIQLQKCGQRLYRGLTDWWHSETPMGTSMCFAIMSDLSNEIVARGDAGDRENFKRSLTLCAYYLDAAYKMCGFLARLYPEQAAAVALLPLR